MKALVKINMALSFHFKSIIFITILFILISVAHVTLLLNQREAVNIWDYLFLSLGGVFIYTQFVLFFGWVSIIFPVLIFVYRIIGNNENFELLVLNRSVSRVKWWTSKFFSIFFISICYSLWYITLHIITGSIFFSTNNNWSIFFEKNFGNIYLLNLKPLSLILLIWLLFTSGIVALSSLAQLIIIIFKNSNSANLIITIVLLLLGQGYVWGFLKREFSPLIYSSFIDLFQSRHDLSIYFNMIIYNILFLTACFVLSIYFIRYYQHPFKNS